MSGNLLTPITNKGDVNQNKKYLDSPKWVGKKQPVDELVPLTKNGHLCHSILEK